MRHEAWTRRRRAGVHRGADRARARAGERAALPHLPAARGRAHPARAPGDADADHDRRRRPRHPSVPAGRRRARRRRSRRRDRAGLRAFRARGAPGSSSPSAREPFSGSVDPETSHISSNVLRRAADEADRRGVALRASRSTPMTASFSRYLVCALLAIAMLPAAARAAAAVPVPAADALTTTAHALAVARWGVDPCGGQVAVTWAHMGAGINARSHVDERRHPRPVDLLAVLDHLQPRHRLGLAQAVHGHRARARPPRRPRARQRPAQRDVALLRLPDRRVRLGTAGRPAGTRARRRRAGPGAKTRSSRRPSARSSSTRRSSARPKKRKAVKRKAVRRKGRAKGAAHAGSSAQLQMIGTPTSTVVDPIRLFEGDVFASPCSGRRGPTADRPRRCIRPLRSRGRAGWCRSGTTPTGCTRAGRRPAAAWRTHRGWRPAGSPPRRGSCTRRRRRRASRAATPPATT